LAAVHEFLTANHQEVAPTSGFITCLLSSLMVKGGVTVWISTVNSIFPPALKLLGISPEKIIFISTLTEKEKLWVMEEALKCEGLAAVVGEIKDIDFTASRRLQLAVEKSRVTGFLIRSNAKALTINACTARWKITSLPSLSNGIPGIGFPRWNIELLKIRNGKPGSWQMEWANNKLQPVFETTLAEPSLSQRKTG
jgi:protein ImuA